MCCALKGHGRLLLDVKGAYVDSNDQLPGKTFVHKEVSLLPFLHIRGAKVGGNDGRPVELTLQLHKNGRFGSRSP